MSFPFSNRMHVGRHNSVHLGKHNNNELHYTIHSNIPSFGEDIGPISFRCGIQRNWCNLCLVNIVK